jgi:hypothetical protein
MAIDPLGREVFVPEAVCLDVTGLATTPFWTDLSPPSVPDAGLGEMPEEPSEQVPGESPDESADMVPDEGPSSDSGSEPEPTEEAPETRVRRVYVLLYYRACLSEPVPAVTPPCSENDQSMVHSRVVDSYRICLAAEAPDDPAETVRSIGLDSAPGDPRQRLLDLILNPPVSLARFWSGQDEAPLLLAVVDLEPIGDPPEGIRLVGGVNNAQRAVLPHVQAAAALALGVRLDGAPAATAFQALAANAALGETAGTMSVRVSLTATPIESSLTAQSARVLRFDDAEGWSDAPVSTHVAIDAGIEITVSESWTESTRYQVCLSGSGDSAILDTTGRPLAGVAGEAVPAGSGRDACLHSNFDPAA